MWRVGLVATRWMGPGAPAGPYLLAGVGVYPLSTTRTFQRTGPGVEPGTPTEGRERSRVPVPGVTLGAGLAGRAVGPVSVGAEARLGLLVGAGNDGILPLASVGFTAALGGP